MSGWAALAKAATDVANFAGNQYSSSKAYRRSKEAAQHAHQWEVGDLRAAGLNPILSATGGQGASAQAFQAAPAELDVTTGLSRGAQAEQAQASARMMDASLGKIKAETLEHSANAAKSVQEIRESEQRIRNLVQDEDYKRTEAWMNVGRSLEILPRIMQLSSTRQMQLANAGAQNALAAKLYNEGLISGEELKAIRSDPEAFKQKVFNLYAPVRSADYYGRDVIGKVKKRFENRRSYFRNKYGTAGGGKTGGW